MCGKGSSFWGSSNYGEFFSKKVEELEGMGGLLNQPFTLTTMTLVVTLRDYCKNIKKTCRRIIVLSHFGFDVPSTQEKHSCCDICITDCQCSECVDLCLDISITESHLLFSRKQLEEIKSELIKYKDEMEASNKYLHPSICSGLTIEVIDEVCSRLQGLHTLVGIKEKLPVWKKRSCRKDSTNNK